MLVETLTDKTFIDSPAVWRSMTMATARISLSPAY
jgi:hypothetical protein